MEELFQGGFKFPANKNKFTSDEGTSLLITTDLLAHIVKYAIQSV